jgi:hypothetical protein
MDKFPFEVLDNIFTRLHFRNKLKCMRVCRHWANAIRDESLLSTVSIIQGENIYVDSLFSLLEREPWRRKQVKNLVFGYSSYQITGCNFRTDLFVNLKFLYLSRENGVYNEYIQHLPRESVAPFMNSIEYVEDRSGSGFVDELLATGTCPRLTTLVLWLTDYDKGDGIYRDMDIDGEIVDYVNQNSEYLGENTISNLFNAPALRKLDFTNFDFQISDFEVIHASLPQLESLTINQGILHKDKLPDDVIPTESLKKLSLLDTCFSPLSLSNMIRYMIKKYTCLQECIIESFSGLCVQEADANAFMAKFSKQLTTFKLPIKTGFVEWFCGFDCQLNALTIDVDNIQSTLKTFSHFPQRTFLKELSILTHFEFDPAPLKELSHLKKLHISCLYMHERPEIDVASVLKSCPDNLTSLTLDDVTLKDELPVDHIFGLQELKIYSRSLPKQFDLFLSKCCPRLRSLTLKACLKAGDYLNISNLSLSYLKINLSDPKTNTRLFVVTPKTELLYYLEGYDDSNTVEGNDEEINCLLYKSCFLSSLPIYPKWKRRPPSLAILWIL